MKVVLIMLLVLTVAAMGIYLFRPRPEPAAVSSVPALQLTPATRYPAPAGPDGDVPAEKTAFSGIPVVSEPVPTNAAVEVPVAEPPVQPLENRGDAMLFEIDALQNTPFDDAVSRPLDYRCGG